MTEKEAKEWLKRMSEEELLKVSGEIERKLYRLARGRRSELVVVPIEELYLLGASLMHRADDEVQLWPRKRRVLYRDGLLISLLAARPIRRKNIAALRIGRPWPVTSRRGHWSAEGDGHEG